MIGTIRKHSKWLLWIIAGATIFSMVYYIGFNPTRGGSSGYQSVNTNLVSGSIYGEKVTLENYTRAKRDVDLYFLLNYGSWALHNPNMSEARLQQEIYIRMMLLQKAKSLGIHVSDAQVEQEAAVYLRSPALIRALGAHTQSVPFDAFVKQVLAEEDMDAGDFQNFVRDDIAVQQLQAIYSLSGEMITPGEAVAEYMRDYQEFSVQAVFFSASNFLSRVSIPPTEVGLFYTNYMAQYRLPDRVQVSYVLFSLSNYLGQAEKQLTNLDSQVANIYTQYGMQATPDAKTPEEAKTLIRKTLIRQEALSYASKQANDFAQVVFNASSSANKAPSPDDLATAARQQNLPVQMTAPFSEEYGPQEFVASEAFIKAAFNLGPDNPISEPIPTPEGVYIIALQTNLPSEIPPLADIRGRVTEDMRFREAAFMARVAGTNFTHELTSHMALGKSFAAAAIAEGYDPQVLPPISLNTSEMPELGDHATLNQLKAAIFTTTVGGTSEFKATDDGGFIVYVESRLPLDQSKMNTDLPEFIGQFRQQRQSQLFSSWIQREASRELRDTPLFKRVPPE
jgi:peptidyl-prolyl cis-trans isomerase D